LYCLFYKNYLIIFQNNKDSKRSLQHIDVDFEYPAEIDDVKIFHKHKYDANIKN